MELVCHPASPAKGVRSVTVAVSRRGAGAWRLDYAVASDGLMLPAAKAPARRDGLWAATCFELFVRRPEGYLEFNFAPSREWAAYAFTGYREGMGDWPMARDPEILAEVGDPFRLAVDVGVPPDALAANVTAVIEEADGTKSYWALTHPSAEPDFHHADGFVLTPA